MRLFCLGILLLAGFTCAAGSFPQLTGRVVDTVNFYTTKQCYELITVLRDFEDATNIKIVVVAVATIDGKDVLEYASELLNYWELGRDNAAALFLIAPKDRKLAIATSAGMQKALTDEACVAIVKGYITPLFKDGRFFDGTKAGLARMMAIVDPLFKPDFASGLPGL